MYNVTLIPGDGVGPEIAEATQKCIEATGVKIDWDVQECGIEVIEKVGKVPDSVLASIRKNKVALKAPITTPIGKGFRSVNVFLRQELGLYACLRPCKTYAGRPELLLEYERRPRRRPRKHRRPICRASNSRRAEPATARADRRHQRQRHRQEDQHRQGDDRRQHQADLD